MKYLLSFYLLISTSILALAQGNAAKQVHASVLPSSANQTVVPVTVPRTSEAEFYKMMYENAVKASEQANTLTQFTLASVLGVIVLVIGAQVFFNYRLGSKEIDNIKADVQAQLATIELAIEQKNNEQLLAITNSATNQIQALEKQLLVTIDKKLERAERLVNYDIKDRERDLRDELKKAQDSIRDIHIYAEQSRADISILKGNKSSALTSYLVVAKLKIEKGEEEKYALSDIIDILKDEKELYITDSKKLEELLPIIKENNSDKKQAISDFITKIPVYEYTKRQSNPYFGGLVGRGIANLGFPFGYQKNYIKNTPK